ncbi:MAG: 30S ribosomal protein S5 [Candidatus Aenigmarchaeota archaeon]|nr:30S ribosomal protein S5 [Candidatus Aenigmarchaeota archaeon]
MPKKIEEKIVEEKAEEIEEVAEPYESADIDEEVPKIKIENPTGWRPKTSLGKQVIEGKITSIDEVFEKGLKITEANIVDILIPNLMNEIVLIGGSSGKGGGKKRTTSRRTTRMHKSGRRFRASAMVIVGNGNGYVGVGMAAGPASKTREVISKATNQAKLNLMPVRRGCGSWECNCASHHSIPFKITGRCGSVYIDLLPAPKGIGLCVNDDSKKYMKLAGIKDIWCKSRGQTSTRYNTIKALVNAFTKLNKFRVREDYENATGLKVGKVD